MLHETPEKRILELKLHDGDKSAWLLYDVGESANPASPQKDYHLRESLVISIRQLVSQATKEGIICLGESDQKASTRMLPTDSDSQLDIPFSIPSDCS